MSVAVASSYEKVMKVDDFIVSKTDTKGNITYCNEIFMDMAGAVEKELIGQPHNIIRHPDMPRAVYKLLWDNIQNGKEVFAYVKNKAFDGSFYWVYANVTPSYDQVGNIIGYYSVRIKPNERALEIIKPIYAKMIELERGGGMQSSTEYLLSLLKDKGVSYDEFIISIQDNQ
jgi:PAS domain S-box-containing protein